MSAVTPATLRLAQFAALYPEEGLRWNLAEPDPALDARPVFFRSDLRSMADWLPLFEAAAAAACR
jgi:hypothetical protein